MTAAPAADDRRAGLDALLEPRTVAVIGASDDPERIGGRVLEHLRRHFAGRTYPVNPSRATVQGLPAHADIGEIDGPVDLAVVALAGKAVPAAVERCAERGVRAAVVISSGFAESGDDTGRAMQERLGEIARTSGMRILGPNSMGSINLTAGVHATFAKLRGFPLDAGHVAIVSQSGAFGLRVFEGALTEGVGVSQLVLTGNEVDITLGEVAEHLLERAEVRVVALFAEGVRDPGSLSRLGRRAAELDKPVVILKAGVSAAGSRAALSHTGSMMVGTRAFDAAMEAAGILVVPTLRNLLAQVKVLAAGKVVRGRRACVLTASGGSGILLADHLEAAGLTLPPTSPVLRARIESAIPEFGSATNPVDYTGQIVNDPGAMPRLLTAVTESGEYDAVLFTGITRAVPRAVLDAILDAASTTDTPFLAWAPQPEVAYEMTRRGVPGVLDLQALAESAAGMLERSRRRELALRYAEPARQRVDAVPRAMTEAQAKHLLAAHGIPVTREGVAGTRAGAVSLARTIGLPVAMKISGDWLAHKTDVGGVRLGIDDLGRVGEVFDELMELAERSRPDGAGPAEVLVQEMVAADLELMCGMVRDPVFGPIVTVGAGGTLAEIVREQHAALAPFDLDHARTLVARIWSGRLVEHPRGLGPDAAAALARLVRDVGVLAAGEPGLVELDINPVAVTEDRVVAVDAFAVMAGAGNA